MKRYLSLLKINLMVGIDQFFQMTSKKKKKGFFSKVGRIGMLLFLALLFTPMFISFGVTGYRWMEVLQGFGLENLLPSIMLFVGAFLTLFMGFTIVPSLYFFANDVETYLAMPISPRHIVSAKFVTAIIEQLYLVLLFQLPVVIGFLAVRFSFQALLGWLITLLLVPVFSTLVVSLIMIIVMQVVPKLRNKQTMTMFTGLVAIIFAVGIGIGSSMISQADGTGLVETILSSGMLFQNIDAYYPPAAAARMMIFGTATDFILGLIIMVGVNLLLLGLFVLLAQRMYLRVALSLSGNAGKSKVLDETGRSKAVVRQRSIFKTLVGRETRMLFRTPAYFLNSVIPALIFPIFFIGMGIYGFVRASGNVDFSGIRLMLERIMAGDLRMQLTIGLGIGGALGFLSTGNGISATAISRDAKHLDFLKSIPCAGHRILFAKVLVGMLFSLPQALVLLLAAVLFAPAEPVLYIGLFGGLLVTVCALNLLELLLDLKHPYLTWTDELKSVKGNLNLMISILVSMGAGIAIFLGILLAKADPFTVVVTTAAVFLALSILLSVYFRKRGDKLLRAVGN